MPTLPDSSNEEDKKKKRNTDTNTRQKHTQAPARVVDVSNGHQQIHALKQALSSNQIHGCNLRGEATKGPACPCQQRLAHSDTDAHTQTDSVNLACSCSSFPLPAVASAALNKNKQTKAVHLDGVDGCLRARRCGNEASAQGIGVIRRFACVRLQQQLNRTLRLLCSGTATMEEWKRGGGS